MVEKKQKKEATKPIPVRFTQSQIKAIEDASEKSGISQQELIRLATAIGLKKLNRINYDVAGAVDQLGESDAL